jgi:hypothetical protein
MSLWFKDPTNSNQRSVPLTLMLVSFVALLVASTFHLVKMTEHTSSLRELFGVCASLYFGHTWVSKPDSTTGTTNTTDKTVFNGSNNG